MKINKLLCFVCGHRWSEWRKVKMSLWSFGNEERTCKRCERADARWSLMGHYPVGSNIKIRMPQRWLVRDTIEREG
jgi:hypothetical protein